MKKVLIFLTLSILFLFASCKDAGTVPTVTYKLSNGGKEYNVIVLDSCEYIDADWGAGDWSTYTMTHKGNCKFCKVRHQCK